MIAKQRDRKCATCRYYESSPLWRKGWCRNPLLYDPQTNHLVEAERLSCSRTFIDYWEPRDSDKKRGRREEIDPGERNPRVAPSIPLEPTGPGGRPLQYTGSGLSTPTAGSTRERIPPPPQLSIVRPESVAPTAASDNLSRWSRPGNTQDGNAALVPEPEAEVVSAPAETAPLGGAPTTELPITPQPPTIVVPVPTPTIAGPRVGSWVDRVGGGLRVGLISAILLALVILVGVNVARGNLKLPVLGKPVPTVTVTVLALIPTDTALPIIEPTIVPTPEPSPTPVPPPAPVLVIGGKATAANLGGDALRIRKSPSAKAAIVTRINEGTQVQIKDGPRDADGITWWQITGFDKKGTSGWASGQFLTPLP